MRRLRERLARIRVLRALRALLQGSRRDAAAELRGTPASSEAGRRGLEADRRGEPTASRDAWAALAATGSEEAGRRLRVVEGRLRETEPSWLPTVAGAPRRLEPASRRRVLHLVKSSVPDRWSGYTIRTQRNMEAQVAAGLEPIVVTELGWPRIAGVTDFPMQATIDGVQHRRLDRGPGYDPRSLPGDEELADLAEALVPVVEDVRPAIIQAHSGHRGGELALVALALRQRFGIPVVYEVRGLFETAWAGEGVDAERSELFRRRLAQEDRILAEVDGVLSISEALTDLLVSRGVARDRIHLLPNGIDPDAFRPAPRDQDLRRRLGLDGRFVVGYVGNLDHRREGLEDLVAAVAELHRRGRTDVAMLVVGDGPRRAALEAAARDARLGEAARFVGRVPHDQVASYYAQMDVHANPRIDEWASRYITPLKPFEAMALGRPILVSDLPALREIADPPHRGLTAAPGDPAALATAIETLAADPALRERIAAAGREWVTTERTWAANGPRYVAAYEAVLGSLD